MSRKTLLDPQSGGVPALVGSTWSRPDTAIGRTDAMNVAVSQACGADRRRTALSHAAPIPFETAGERHGSALALRGVAKRFGGIQAIVDVDMEVARGEVHAVIGPNGAGKSTLLNLISGLYAADAGTISIDGAIKPPIARDLSRRGVSRTFQNLALFEGLTVAQNVAMGRRFRAEASTLEQILALPRSRRDRRAADRHVDDMLAFLGLGEVRDRHLNGLPYGVLKRIELARALVALPRLLLLDEPLAGMSGSEKPEMARLIRAARDTFGTTIVLIEHDVDIVMGLADRLTVLDYGRKIAEGTPGEIRRNPAVIAAYLGQDLAENAA